MIMRLACGTACFVTLLFSSVAPAQQAATNAPPPAGTPPSADSSNDAYTKTLREAYQLVAQGKLDDALAKATAAIQINPKDASGYVLRASIYSEKKIYDKSEEDFKAALQIDDKNFTVKFNLAEIKFMQKQYAAARPEFAALVNVPDEDFRDLASYKVFLCDLYGGQADNAAKELAAFNQAGSRPSYYFGNAAWDLFNHKTEDARGWLTSATHIYAPQKNSLYAASLKTLGYLPLPEPVK